MDNLPPLDRDFIVNGFGSLHLELAAQIASNKAKDAEIFRLREELAAKQNATDSGRSDFAQNNVE